MQQSYLASINLIERLHRQFLEVIKAELDKLGEKKINNVQALILFNIGKDMLTVGELTHRGYYQGSNVSYNVKKMVENGYLVQEPSPHDKRSIRIKLSDQGLELWGKLTSMFAEHIQKLESSSIEKEDFNEANQTFQELEKFWTSVLNQAGINPFESF